MGEVRGILGMVICLSRVAQENLGHCSAGTAAAAYPALQGKRHVPLPGATVGGFGLGFTQLETAMGMSTESTGVPGQHRF